MANPSKGRLELIDGRPALIVIDIQANTFLDDSAVRFVDNMPAYKQHMLKARVAIDEARELNVPVIFI